MRHNPVRIRLLFTSLSLVTLLAALSQHLFVPALPVIVAEFDGSQQMSWIVVAFILASIPTMPIFGKLSDVFGRKNLLIVGIALFTIGSLLGALAPSMEWLIVARVVQGIGSGGLVILPQAAIADVVPARSRGLYAGILSAVFAASSIAGPVVGGLLAQGPGWRWGFWLNLPLGVLAAIGVAFMLKLPAPARNSRPRIDYTGMALISLATTALALVTTWGGIDYAWNSPLILAISAIGILAVIILPSVERRAVSPVLPPQLFRDRNFIVTSIASIGLAMVMFSFLGYLPTFVQMSLGASPSDGGLAMIPMAIGTLIASTVSGQIVSRTGRYKTTLVVGAVIVTVGAGLMYLTVYDSSLVTAATAGGIVGLGLGCCFNNIIVIVQNAFPHSVVGTATAATSLFRQVGGMFGTSLVGAMFARGLTLKLREQLPADDFAAVGGSPDVAVIASLDDRLQQAVADAFTAASAPVYLVMAVIALVSATVLCGVRPVPLSRTIEAEEPARTAVAS